MLSLLQASWLQLERNTDHIEIFPNDISEIDMPQKTASAEAVTDVGNISQWGLHRNNDATHICRLRCKAFNQYLVWNQCVNNPFDIS